MNGRKRKGESALPFASSLSLYTTGTSGTLHSVTNERHCLRYKCCTGYRSTDGGFLLDVTQSALSESVCGGGQEEANKPKPKHITLPDREDSCAHNHLAAGGNPISGVLQHTLCHFIFRFISSLTFFFLCAK